MERHFTIIKSGPNGPFTIQTCYFLFLPYFRTKSILPSIYSAIVKRFMSRLSTAKIDGNNKAVDSAPKAPDCHSKPQCPESSSPTEECSLSEPQSDSGHHGDTEGEIASSLSAANETFAFTHSEPPCQAAPYPMESHTATDSQSQSDGTHGDIEGDVGLSLTNANETSFGETVASTHSEPPCQAASNVMDTAADSQSQSDGTHGELEGDIGFFSTDTEDTSNETFTATPIPSPIGFNVKKRKTSHKRVTRDYEMIYNWLYYSVAKQGYLCKICEMSPKQSVQHQDSPFVSGTVLGDHPIRKLDKHQSSSIHKQSVQRLVGSKTESISVTITKKKSDDVQRNQAYMESLVDTVYLVVKKHWALDSVADLMKHMQALKCPSVTAYMERNTVSYTSSTSVSDILSAIGVIIEKQVLTEVNNAKYIAVLADESTDEANRTQFAVMLRYLDAHGTVEDHFAGLIKVQRTDAESLMTALENFIVNKGIDITKVMFVGFDGCNVMSGVNKGLQRRFRHRVPHSIYINCRSHRLALCVKHLIKDFPVLDEVDNLMLSIFKLFEYSPQKFAVFLDVQATYGMKGMVMVRAAATRWLSHGSACHRIISRYEQILDTLDHVIREKKTPEVTGLRIALTSKNVVAAILILSDILVSINVFCKYLQGSVDFTTVSLKLKDLIDTLTNLAGKFRDSLQGPNDLQFSKVTQLFELIDERTEFARVMRGANALTPEQLVEELAVPMVYKLIQELEDGFHCSPVLDAFSAISMRNLPLTVNELPEYGNVAIQTLTSHYGSQKTDEFQGHVENAPPLFNKVEAENEFQAFKHQMFMHRRRHPESKSVLQMCVDDPILADTFPSMYHLILLSALIPTSTASVERIFSLMNTVCTQNRNRLTQETLTTLMQICREGGDVLTPGQKHMIIQNFAAMKMREITL